ncbi:MAG: PIG-L family deacetylase [Candidatus Eremiobacteraeota bacterium]|nr:PIG-L family deacetylase [Candidatus Eremiobacteraeota bacterium]
MLSARALATDSPYMLKPFDTVLVCAAHPDDEVLGCGGTIAKDAAAGSAVHILILGQGLYSRGDVGDSDALEKLREAARRSAAILGARSITFGDLPDNRMDEVGRLDVVKIIEDAIDRLRPDAVYSHHFGDMNIDHVRVNECVSVACRPQPSHGVKELRFFEVPSSTEWRPTTERPFMPNIFVDIDAFLAQKLAALREYDQEMRPWPHPRSYQAVEHLARWRGASAGVAAAEAFVLGRRIEGGK